MKKIKKSYEKWYAWYTRSTSYFWPKFTIVDQSLPTASGGLFFSTQKMHISEYVCKTCLKELGILLKCRETFEKFLAAGNFFENIGLSQFFFKGFWQLYFKNINFQANTKRCLYAEFYEFKTKACGRYFLSNFYFLIKP